MQVDFRKIVVATCLAVVAVISLLTRRSHAAAPLSVPATAVSEPAASQPFVINEPIVRREVGKKVRDFGETPNLDSPESAYAAINRVLISGKMDAWRSISPRRMAGDLRGPDSPPKTGKAAEEYLDAEILEVLTFRQNRAMVVARLAREQMRYDLRSMVFENGRWLNTGEDVVDTPEQVEPTFCRICSFDLPKPAYPPVGDPDAVRRGMLDFLQKNGREPKAFLLEALARHPLVIVGETHHRPAYWSLLTGVATAPEFAGGVVYLELPSHRQEQVDQFLANDKLDDQLVIQTLRDMMNTGWPDQTTLDFFRQVWKANQGRQDDRKVRIVLADMPRAYDKVATRQDLMEWNRLDRNEYMAQLVQRDLSGPSKGRKAMFVVGFYHAVCGMRRPVGGYPMKSAGWRLRQAFPEAYFVLEHGPVMTNEGDVKGRAALGMFDDAFAANGNRPLAFPLAESLFAPLFFDRIPEETYVGSYGQAFDACLFLQPLEDEVFSPPIDGFYDETFVKEIHRRAKLEGGSHSADTTAEEFTARVKHVWGQPRAWRNCLGPSDAWVQGSNWQKAIVAAKHREALSQPDIILKAAAKLFETVRNAPAVDEATLWKLHYTTDHYYDAWIEWMKKTFASDPVEKVELGRIFENSEHLPTIEYRLILRSGRRLEGNLPFRYDALSQEWSGLHGLDWHLDRPTTASAPASRPG